jgi:4-hydroxy-2-oxoglutarate aldolase
MLLEGLQLPLTTPFYPDGRLNLRKLEHNAARYSRTLAAGLVALSNSGEPTMLSDVETHQTLTSVSEAASSEKVLIAGVSRDSVAGTLDLVEYAAKAGYDAVLVKPSSVLRTGANPKEFLLYFQAIADRSALPVVLCNTPGRSLSIEAIVELAGHPQIIGLVDEATSADRVRMLKTVTAHLKYDVTVTTIFTAVTRRMQTLSEGDGLIAADTLTGGTALAIAPKPALKTRVKTVEFQILAGGTATMLESLQAGATGVVPAFAASAPQACYEVLAAWKDGDAGLAQEKQLRLIKASGRIEAELGVAGIKYGCDLNGYFGGQPRLPLLPLSGEERAEIEGLMQGLKN